MCNTTPTNMGGLTLTTSWQNATGTSGAKRYWTFNATAGCTYDFSTCNSLFTNDTYLRLYSGTNPLTAVLQTSNDDNGPFCVTTKASISWVCSTTGVYSILVTNWSCANLSASTILSYRQTCTPPYNPCTTIPTIVCGTTNNLTIASGNGIYNPPSTTCGFSTPGKEYIYSFTPTISGNYTISQPTSFGYVDWFYKVASGGCNGTGWTCIDDISNANVGNANINIPLTAGTTYYIMGDPESSVGGNVVWTLNCPTLPPANDDCLNATTITLPYSSGVMTNNPATDDVPTSTSSCGTQGSNVWYKFIATGTDYVTATTCNGSTNFDTEVRVYTNPCGSMTEVVCNDDDATCVSSGVQSTATWCTTLGTTYYISVGYFAAGVGYGNFVLSVNTNGSCSILPIELVSFEGFERDNYNFLTWVVATETNNDFFTLERSVDGVYWEPIAFINGAGTTSTSKYYDYKDYTFISGSINYYRIKQTDFNGNYEYFNIISIIRKLKNKPILIKTINSLGQEVNPDTPGFLLEIYSDGSTKKIIN